ncbi:hypothetical protein [Methylosinus sp. Sm6]|uniref:hypothetical protein n=1 Tax=Methylosinus sp. Sm6 TaxID=2866948 RepID=UPI001C9A29C6|nr:hypothetical protein [Methylosinus sp. Sm6]MBY6239871.1 hypothetical protein [Methylosinus sp. Sm6]
MRRRDKLITAFCLTAFLAMGRAGAEDADMRAPLALTASEKAFVLDQMRLFVKSLEQIVSGLATDDRAAVAEAAAARGGRRFQAEGKMPETLAGRFPDRWTGFGRPMRAGFDELARRVTEGESKNQSLARLGEIMRNCVGCHAAYRIVDAPN